MPRMFGTSTGIAHAGSPADAREHLVGVRELRHGAGAHERRHLDDRKPGVGERLDEGDLGLGRHERAPRSAGRRVGRPRRCARERAVPPPLDRCHVRHPASSSSTSGSPPATTSPARTCTARTVPAVGRRHLHLDLHRLEHDHDLARRRPRRRPRRRRGARWRASARTATRPAARARQAPARRRRARTPSRGIAPSRGDRDVALGGTRAAGGRTRPTGPGGRRRVRPRARHRAAAAPSGVHSVSTQSVSAVPPTTSGWARASSRKPRFVAHADDAHLGERGSEPRDRRRPVLGAARSPWRAGDRSRGRRRRPRGAPCRCAPRASWAARAAPRDRPPAGTRSPDPRRTRAPRSAWPRSATDRLVDRRAAGPRRSRAGRARGRCR